MADRLLAIDPGNEQSAYVVLEDGLPDPIRCDIVPNVDLLDYLRDGMFRDCAVVCEWLESYGMPVGATVFHTCRWIGRFQEACDPVALELMPRRAVKLYVCQSARAKDANVRAALIEHYGPTRSEAVGTKRHPGPLYGFKADMWAALGVAFTAARVRDLYPPRWAS